MDWYFSAPSVVSRPVIWKSTEERRGRGFLSRQRVYHRLEVNDWASTEKLRLIHVSKGLYEHARVGDRIEFEQRSGYWGIRWAIMKRWVPAEQR